MPQIISLSPEQRRALDKTVAWLEHPGDQQVFRLFGYAGTGKTSLATYVQASDPRPQTIRFAAYTGKAAYVLRSKGCRDATTIHNLIYQRLGEPGAAITERILPVVDIAEVKGKKLPNEAPEFDPREAIRGTRLIIIDECSMINETIGRDLLATGCLLLVIGDPAQLPPVKGESGFFLRAEPDVLLTQIQRFGEGTPIYEMAQRVRNHERLRPGDFGVISGDRFDQDMLLRANQIIVGRNSTRRKLNKIMRQINGYEDRDWLPLQGDKLVCLKNNHQFKPPLLNGSLWRVIDTKKGQGEITKRSFVHLGLTSEDGGREIEATVPVGFFGQGDVPFEETYESFTYGYALTAHKAQGSEWDNVLIFDEGWVFKYFHPDEDMPWRWLYTAITRAKKAVTVVNYSKQRPIRGLAL